MRCRVETYSGFRLHERPRRFTWGETWLEVNQVTDQWLTPGHLWFEVRVAECAYRLTYNQAEDVWEARLVRPGAGPPAG